MKVLFRIGHRILWHMAEVRRMRAEGIVPQSPVHRATQFFHKRRGPK